MHQYIISTWNNTVKPNDEVFVLGDFSLNPKWSDTIVPNLNGLKRLIVGNHDACFPWKGVYKHTTRYFKAGWTDINQSLILDLKDDTKVLLNHMPYLNKDFDQRYPEYRPKDEGLILLHGHEHGRYVKNKRMIDVGIDAHELKLVSEDRLIEIINDKRELIPSSLTEFYKKRKDDKNEKS